MLVLQSRDCPQCRRSAQLPLDNPEAVCGGCSDGLQYGTPPALRSGLSGRCVICSGLGEVGETPVGLMCVSCARRSQAVALNVRRGRPHGDDPAPPSRHDGDGDNDQNDDHTQGGGCGTAALVVGCSSLLTTAWALATWLLGIRL